MPKIIKRLAETKIRNAPIKAQAYTLRDGDGLTLVPCSVSNACFIVPITLDLGVYSKV